jgi:uncharacterized membrane protein
MPRFCASCGAALAEGALTCPSCGTAASASAAGAGGTATAPAAAPAAGGLTDNVAGMLAYVTIIPAIIFLVIEPYNRKRFVRFHSFQSIFFCVAWIVLSIAVSIVTAIPFLGLVSLLIWPIIGIGGLILWVILLLKANQGQMWKLPLIGDMAEKQANAVA